MYTIPIIKIRKNRERRKDISVLYFCFTLRDNQVYITKSKGICPQKSVQTYSAQYPTKCISVFMRQFNLAWL